MSSNLNEAQEEFGLSHQFLAKQSAWQQIKYFSDSESSFWRSKTVKEPKIQYFASEPEPPAQQKGYTTITFLICGVERDSNETHFLVSIFKHKYSSCF